jgi:hypothetical protein
MACSSEPSKGGSASGGTGAVTGGTSSGGAATGGASGGIAGSISTGGVSTGGVMATGGQAGGGSPSAGATSGGSSGSVTGGASATGGAGSPSTGGAPTAGATNGGSGGGGGKTGGGGSAGATGGSGGGGKSGGCNGALFCEDFEAYDAGKAPGSVWTARTDAGAVSVDTTQHTSGSKSVKFTTQAKDGNKTAFIRLKSDAVFPIAGNAFFGRMMFRLEAAPTGDVHWTMLQSTGTVPGQNYRSQYRYGGQHPVTAGSQLMANYDTPDSYSGTGPSTDCWQHANGVAIPTGKWTCVEWKFDGPQNQMRLWLDGKAITDVSIDGKGQGCLGQDASYTWAAPTFGDIEIGWESYQNDQARTVFIDDVAISTTQIGCPSVP